MTEPIDELRATISTLQAKSAALEDRLRGLETSYTIDRRVVLVVAAAFAALLVAFTGFSLSQMPDKLVAKLEADVQSRTGKTIDDRVKAVDATLSKATDELAKLNSASASLETVGKTLEDVKQKISSVEKRRLQIQGVDVSHTAGRTLSLKYSDSGYSMSEGVALDCPDGEYLIGYRIFTNKEAKVAGYSANCRAVDVSIR